MPLHKLRLRLPVFLLVSAILCPSTLWGQFVLSGTISDDRGEPLPFAHVIVQEGTAGSASGVDGSYQVELGSGVQKLRFAYIGFQALDTTLNVTGNTRLDVALRPESYELAGLVIKANAEDPAMEMMRKVIARRDSIMDLVPEYSVDTYIKGLQRVDSAPDKIFGFDLAGLGILDSNNAGILYLSESESRLHVQRPDKTREVMYASRVSGDDQAFSWNSAAAMEIEIHNSPLSVEGLSQRPLISPLADNAFFFYRFRLVGSQTEDGLTVNKIEVVPRRNADPVFRGHLYVVEDLWRVKASDLLLTRSAGIDFVDSLIFRTTYAPLNSIPNDSLFSSAESGNWMPRSREFQFQFRALGIRGRGYFLSYYKNYDTDPQFGRRFFGLQQLEIVDSANTRDSLFWSGIRPVALSREEVRDYREKDSIAILREDRTYLDSLDRIRNRPAFGHLITGYRHRSSFNKNYWSIGSPLEWINFNTVEGWTLGLSGGFHQDLEHARHIAFRPSVRYGTANNFWAAQAEFEAGLNAKTFSLLRIRGGREVLQLFPGTVWPLANTFYTLLWEQNDVKLYARDFVDVRYGQEIANGLTVRAGVRWSSRMPMTNSSDRVWNDREGAVYSSNNPLVPEDDSPAFEPHKAFLTSFRIGWRPGQVYMTEPDRKFIMGSDWPDFILLYRAGWPVAGSELRFDHLSLTIKDEVPLGLFGTTSIRVTGGDFLKADSLTFMDWAHFHGNSTFFMHPTFDRFQILPPYARATPGASLEMHVEHHFNGFVFNKIPGIRKTRVQLIAGGRGLWTDEGWYGELAVGIEHIFKIIRADFVAGWGEGDPRYSGRIGVGF